MSDVPGNGTKLGTFFAEATKVMNLVIFFSDTAEKPKL
jgi:hypothetical protein